MLLNESGIKLPKGSKSARVLAHSDMDGFMSALLTVNQLVRQGIPKERIDVKWVQYGDYDLLDKATKKNRYQAMLSVDFSAFPTVDLERSFSALTKKTGGYKEKFVTDYSGSKGTFPAFMKAFRNEYSSKISAEQFKQWVSKNISSEVDVIKNPRKVYSELSSFIKALNNVGDGDTSKVKITDLDYASDHHDNTKDDLTPGKAGKIGKTEFKSDTEHLATVSAQGLMNWEDLKEISKVDSAQYNDLENVISMSGNLKGEGRKERLAVMINALVTSIIKSNKDLATKLVKESAPSLISVYNNALKFKKLNDNQLKIFSELKKDEPDFALIENLSKGFTPSEKKKMLRSGANKDIKPVSSIEQMRKKDLASKEANVSGITKDFTPNGVVLIQKAESIKANPPRYLGSLLSKEGKRFPFIIKRYSMLIQVQGNASLSKEDRETIDLGEICKRAVDEAEKRYGSFSNKWAWDIIRKESGGHKTIWNISGLTTLGAASLNGAERGELKYVKDFKDRVSKLSVDKGRKAELMANKSGTLKTLEKKKGDADLLKKVSDFLVDYIAKELNSKYGHLKLDKFRDDYDIK